MSRAALLKTAHRAVFAPSSAMSPQLFESTRPVSLALQQNKNLSVLSYVEVFWWARVDVASRASKKAPQGLFCPPDYSAGRCCSNPPSRVRLRMPGKTKNQRNFYAGPFGGRGWIRTTEAESSRFTVCPHWPLGNTPIFTFCVLRRTTCLFYHAERLLSTVFLPFSSNAFSVQRNGGKSPAAMQARQSRRKKPAGRN